MISKRSFFSNKVKQNLFCRMDLIFSESSPLLGFEPYAVGDEVSFMIEATVPFQVE